MVMVARGTEQAESISVELKCKQAERLFPDVIGSKRSVFHRNQSENVLQKTMLHEPPTWNRN